MRYLSPGAWVGWTALVLVAILLIAAQFLSGLLSKLLWAVAVLVAAVGAFHAWQR